MVERTPIRRVLRTKNEAKACYNGMSWWYDLLTATAEKKYKDMGLEMLNVLQGEIVLEIGFGTGQCLTALARSAGESGRVYGIDLSEGMCNVAEKRMNKSGMLSRVDLRCGDAAQLPFQDSFFDAIFMSFTLELFDTPEIPVVLNECQRVLKPDGRLGIVAMSKKENGNIMVEFYEWAHDRFTRYIDCRPIYPSEALQKVGFKILGLAETSMFGLPVDIILAEK